MSTTDPAQLIASCGDYRQPVPVDVAVIPCAGAGTRMRPATRVVPKPLLPVIDRPVIQYVVEEAAAAGVTEVVLVVDDRPGDPIVSHFTADPPIEGLDGLIFTKVLQSEALGLGHAVLQAADAVGERPFLCLLSDMFPRPGRGYSPRLTAAFEDRMVLAVQEVPDSYFERWGFVEVGPGGADDAVEVIGAVEKPGASAPSNLGIPGRYVFTPGLFERLRHQAPGHGGELQLTDAIDDVARTEGATGIVVGDDLFDTGNPAGMLEAITEMGLARKDLSNGLRDVLDRLLTDSG